MSQEISISSALAETLADYVRSTGIEAPEILSTLAPYSSTHRMPLALFCELLDQLRALHPVPALGLRVGRCVRPQHFGVVGYLAASCSSLGQALTRYRRFQTLLESTLDVRPHQRGDVMRFTWNHDLDTISALASEFSVAAFVSLYQALIGQAVPPLTIELPFEPTGHASIHEALMGCPVRFKTPGQAIEIPTSLLSMRISTSDPYMRSLFDQQAHAMLEQHATPDHFLERLQNHMADALQQGDASATTLARRMGYSPRSFYRELDRNGLRYRAILGDVRFRLARMYLADPRLSLAEIALVLGYSEQSAFSRAFRSWTGDTPQAYRDRLVNR